MPGTALWPPCASLRQPRVSTGDGSPSCDSPSRTAPPRSASSSGAVEMLIDTPTVQTTSVPHVGLSAQYMEHPPLRDPPVVTPGPGTGAHQGSPTGQAHRAQPWSTAITATTDERVFVRGVALDEAIGREPFPAMVLRLWRGDAPTQDEADLLGACLVAAIDHGPLSPSALVTRTIASTRATPMSGLAGGILAFSEFHGAVVSRAMRIMATAPADGDLEPWANRVFESERDAGRRLPGIGHRWHSRDLRAESAVAGRCPTIRRKA